jgi:hypothetical protein
MLDFPATPVDGATYDAPNGVRYQWSAAQGLWLVVTVTPPPVGGTGAVQAGSGNFSPVLNTDVVIVFATALSGNDGGWLNLTNGRYTPPAGKFFIQSTFGMQAPTSGNGTWALKPRKNGVVIPAGQYGSGAAQFSIPITVGLYVDANGTDYFDWVGNILAAGMAVQGGSFTAFPLTGIQGPPGPVGTVVGDFWAYNSANLTPAANVVTVLLANTIGCGNQGGWYNPVNGRATLPAGRHHIFATCIAAAGQALQYTIYLRKNGVNIPGAVSWETPAAANYYATAKIGANVDATGSDYFDVTINPNTAGTSVIAFNFGAMPVRGLP